VSARKDSAIATEAARPQSCRRSDPLPYVKSDSLNSQVKATLPHGVLIRFVGTPDDLFTFEARRCLGPVVASSNVL